MIAKVGKRGADTLGLLRYLFGPGAANEHTDPHLVAAWDPEWLRDGAFAPLIEPGRRGALPRLGREIDAAMTGHQVRVDGGHVYHVVLSVPPSDSTAQDPAVGLFGETRWRAYAESAIAHMGLGPDEIGKGGCRWVAVHHGLSAEGNDHVHLVVNVVGGDGRIANLHRDFFRWRDWCRTVEDRDDLTRTAPAGEGRAAATTRPELQRAVRTGRPTEREVLRRLVGEAAAAASAEWEFIRLLAQAGVLAAPHVSGGRVSGYKVALPPVHGADPFWLAGSALRRDLSLPRLRERWPAEPVPDEALTQMWSHPRRDQGPRSRHTHMWLVARRCLEAGATELRENLARDPDPVLWHNSVRQTADLTAVLLRNAELEPDEQRLLARVHDQLTRVAQPPRGTRPGPGELVAPLLAQAARAVARGRDPRPVMLAAILVLLVAVILALAEHAHDRQLRAAARQQITTAEHTVTQLADTVQKRAAAAKAAMTQPDVVQPATPQPPAAQHVRKSPAARPPLPGERTGFRPPPPPPLGRRTR